MKTLSTILIVLALAINLMGNGVAVTDAKNAYYLTLKQSDIDVTIDNQVATVVTRQVFKNELGTDKKVKYAFPMPEDASATELKYQVDDQWYLAKFSALEPDTTLPSQGGEVHPNLEQYLGETPLYYNLTETIRKDSLLIVELTYVQLLPYKLGIVELFYPNDYHLIQSSIIGKMTFDCYLTSDRTINRLELIGLEPESINVNTHSADVHFITYEVTAGFNYNVEYELSLDELGLFDMSTSIADSLVPDDYGSGFFTFIAEPDPGENVIEKVFTLIIDRSGSMSGEKIIQARDAASFIVENLNEGDRFNIVDFATDVRTFRSEHVDFTPSNQSAALSYISGLNATGGTNISGSFGVAIPQFSTANDTTANIIIFFTDGQATAGITDTQGILDHVTSLVNANQTEVMIFTFGIGYDANAQLLTLLATENLGLAEFLGNDELEERISEFYLTIRNPVLLNTEMTFSPQVFQEIYPQKLPNLYIGQQMIVSGRYTEAVPVTVTLSGEAFGQPVEYQYEMNPADSTIDKNKFLTKIWAKQKIEDLLIEYYKLEENSPEALFIHEEIVGISLNYGVLTPFTSFSGSDPTGLEEDLSIAESREHPQAYELLGNYPNPFNPVTTISFRVNTNLHGIVHLKIYNSLGQIIRIMTMTINGPGIYQIAWDGLIDSGSTATSGNYFYIIDFGEGLLAGKMTLMR